MAPSVSRSQETDGAIMFLLFQFYTILKSVSDFLSHLKVSVVDGIKSNWLKLGRINFAVFSKNTFVCADVYNLTYHAAGFLIVADESALQRHGQFVDKRSIHKFRLRSMLCLICREHHWQKQSPGNRILLHGRRLPC